MFVAELAFLQTERQASEEARLEAIYSLLGTLWRNGQILSSKDLIACHDNSYSAFVTLPEVNSLNRKNNNKQVHQDYRKLSEAGLKQPGFRVIGVHPLGGKSCKCKKKEWLILFTHYLSQESPLGCGSCFNQIPLYWIPLNNADDYDDIVAWQSDYQSCDSLQMGCTTGERFASREMSRLDISLSKRGIDICRKIEKSTNLLTYYYLYRYNGRNMATEKNRRCPSCAGEWRLKETLHRLFDFRCDNCRLLSNIAWSVS